MQDLEGRVAVVTGAASGIGFGMSEALVAAGMKVMMADIDATRLRAKEAQLSESGHEVATFVVDITDSAAVDALADATLERFGTVNVVCNNAGIIRRGYRTWELPLEDWRAVLEVNLFGVVHGLRTFVPILLDSGEEGHIVNTASLAAVSPVPELGPYNASKHGVLGISEALDAELRAAGASIGVTILMPGLVRTRIGQPSSAPDPEGPLDPGQMDPREVGTLTVEAIRENRLHLFTHPELIDMVKARFARITDS